MDPSISILEFMFIDEEIELLAQFQKPFLLKQTFLDRRILDSL